MAEPYASWGWDLNKLGARVDTSHIIPGGLYPLYARGTANGACIHLRAATPESPGSATIVTNWEGGKLYAPLSLPVESGAPEKALLKVLEVWASAVRFIREGRAHGTLPAESRHIVQALSWMSDESERPAPNLSVGDCVAYLLPCVPLDHQARFEIAKITRLHPLELSNNHHNTVFRSGVGELARYDPETERVIFPMFELSSVQ